MKLWGVFDERQCSVKLRTCWTDKKITDCEKELTMNQKNYKKLLIKVFYFHFKYYYTDSERRLASREIVPNTNEY